MVIRSLLIKINLSLTTLSVSFSQSANLRIMLMDPDIVLFLYRSCKREVACTRLGHVLL